MAAWLWEGADVRWTGPAWPEAGDPGEPGVRPGDIGVVVDPGPWQLPSAGVIQVGGPRSPRRAGSRAVRVRFGAHEVDVGPEHLELLAPPGPLRPESVGGLASWALARLTPLGGRRGEGTAVSAVVPSGFPAIARVLHPWERSTGTEPWWVPTTWHDVVAHYGGRLHPEVQAEALAPPERWAVDGFAKPERGALTPDIARTLVEILEPATSTPGDACMALWEGHGDEPPERWPGAALVGDDFRRYVLLRGPVAAARTPLGVYGCRIGPQLWWPADRAWVVVSEIDFAWTYVAGRQEVVDAVLAHPALEAVPAAYEHRADIDADHVNRPAMA